MKILPQIVFLFFFYGTFGQHNDLKEYGFKGKVKRITTYNYDTLCFDISTKGITDTSLWRSKIIFAFNEQGNFDTIYSFTQIPMYSDTIYSLQTVFLYKNNQRTAVRINGLNEITDTIKYIWMTDTSYKTIETDMFGRRKVLSDLFLTKNYRDKSGKYIGYDENDKIEYGEDYENIIDTNNLLTKSFKTNLVTNMKTIVEYKYFDFDWQNNPARIYLTDLVKGKLYRITLRKFEYQ